jgi:hypothetical protein
MRVRVQANLQFPRISRYWKPIPPPEIREARLG